LRCREVRPAKISPSHDGIREVGVGQAWRRKGRHLLRLALLRLAPVRFWLAKFQPVRSFPSKPIPCQIVGQVAGGAIEFAMP